MNTKKMQYLTTASRLRGVVAGLNKERNAVLIPTLEKAADLLTEVWDEYAKANGYDDIKVPTMENKDEPNQDLCGND